MLSRRRWTMGIAAAAAAVALAGCTTPGQTSSPAPNNAAEHPDILLQGTPVDGPSNPGHLFDPYSAQNRSGGAVSRLSPSADVTPGG